MIEPAVKGVVGVLESALEYASVIRLFYPPCPAL